MASAQPSIAVTPAIQPPTEASPSVVITVPTPTPQSNEQRWRAQQIDRHVFDPKRIYIATSPVTLLWYDPVASQTLEIGTLLGEFTVQAEFTFRPRDVAALEVPYRINQDYGLTSISPAVEQRMEAAGFTESVEAFVLESDAIQPPKT